MAVKNGRRSSTYSEYVEKWEKDPLNNGKLTVIRYANVSEVKRKYLCLTPEALTIYLPNVTFVYGIMNFRFFWTKITELMASHILVMVFLK